MVEYSKQWLSLSQQVERLKAHGLEIPDEDHALRVLAAIGYYRLIGYLYPFRESEESVDGLPAVLGQRFKGFSCC
jgi:abortive infection bacteriophage resistance protein